MFGLSFYGLPCLAWLVCLIHATLFTALGAWVIATLDFAVFFVEFGLVAYLPRLLRQQSIRHSQTSSLILQRMCMFTSLEDGDPHAFFN